jgi:acetylornithine deacetylase/succinyl-diaminopimelate desuccinylase-like protein
VADLDDFILEQNARFVQELFEYLRIPSVSARPEHGVDMRRCADWTAQAMKTVGIEHVQVIETGGNPIVYGDWVHAPGAPTILFYGHYDVQPIGDLTEWHSPPFEPVIRDDMLYARGATDDKGQLYVHLKAVEAHLRCRGRLPVNMRMLIEGEEEVGGERLADFVRTHSRTLAADVVVDSDNAMLAPNIPSLTYAMRGLACMRLEVFGAARELHSGSFGGTIENPAFVLASLLAQLKDASGRVSLPGFYADVRALTAAERREFASLR